MHFLYGLPVWLSDKETACNSGDVAGAMGSIPGAVRSLKEGNEIHSHILAWKIPWTEGPGGLCSPWDHKETQPSNKTIATLSVIVSQKSAFIVPKQEPQKGLF